MEKVINKPTRIITCLIMIIQLSRHWVWAAIKPCPTSQLGRHPTPSRPLHQPHRITSVPPTSNRQHLHTTSAIGKTVIGYSPVCPTSSPTLHQIISAPQVSQLQSMQHPYLSSPNRIQERMVSPTCPYLYPLNKRRTNFSRVYGTTVSPFHRIVRPRCLKRVPAIH